MGIFMSKRLERKREETQYEILDSGDFLVAKATPAYVATVLKDTVARKISKLIANTELTYKAPELLPGYEQVRTTLDEVFNALKYLKDAESKAKAITLADDEVFEKAIEACGEDDENEQD